MGVTVALSVTFLLAGLAVQHMALLNRQMRFKAIALIQIGSVLAGVLVGIGMAWLNYGYWSLVGMNVTTNVVALLMTWSASRVASSILYPAQRHAVFDPFRRQPDRRDFLVLSCPGVGRTFDRPVLRSRFQSAFIQGQPPCLHALWSNLPALSKRCFIPALSRLQIQPDRYRRTFLQLYDTIALISFPFYRNVLRAGSSLDPRCAGTQVGSGGDHFCRLYICRSSVSAWIMRQLALHQPGSRQGIISCEFDYFNHHDRLFHSRPSVRAGRSGDCLFRLLFADPVAHFLLARGPAWSGGYALTCGLAFSGSCPCGESCVWLPGWSAFRYRTTSHSRNY